MKPKYKVIVLVTIALLVLAGLVQVNQRNVRDTGPRGSFSVSTSEGRTPDAESL